MNLNNLLTDQGINPAEVLVMRHRPENPLDPHSPDDEVICCDSVGDSDIIINSLIWIARG